MDLVGCNWTLEIKKPLFIKGFRDCLDCAGLFCGGGGGS